jgi:hypothetical protein
MTMVSPKTSDGRHGFGPLRTLCIWDEHISSDARLASETRGCRSFQAASYKTRFHAILAFTNGLLPLVLFLCGRRLCNTTRP